MTPLLPAAAGGEYVHMAHFTPSEEETSARVGSIIVQSLERDSP